MSQATTGIGYDELCGYYESPHQQWLHENEVHIPLAEASRKLHTILHSQGQARVYFVAVSCQGAPGVREARKMQRWINAWNAKETHRDNPAELVGIENSVYGPAWGKNKRSPAVKMIVKSGEDFVYAFKSLAGISNSSCSCSIMVNDAQGTDVRVMELNYVAGGERPW